MKADASKKSLLVTLAIPFCVACAFALANLSGFYRVFEYRMFDALLHARPEVKEDKGILMLDIDDTAIANAGLFPWPRDYMAEGLLVMSEYGAKYAVFDIEYVDKSPLGVNATVLKEDLPALVESEFSTINTNTNDLFDALKSGYISPKDASGQIAELTELNIRSGRSILNGIDRIARDNDDYLGSAARFFGKAFFTINMLKEKGTATQEQKKYASDNFAITAIETRGQYTHRAADLRPAILPILSKAAGAGFPNVFKDDDGVLRRINLLSEFEGKYYPQLSFALVLDMLGKPKIELDPDEILLKGAILPGTEEPRDIRLPLADDYYFLLNWPKKPVYEESFRHLSFYKLLAHKKTEDDLVFDLKIMKDSGYLAYYKKDTKEEGSLLDILSRANEIKAEILAGGNPSKAAEYAAYKDRFFEETRNFLSGDAEASLIADLDRVLASPKLSRELKARYEEAKADVPTVFEATRNVFATLSEIRTSLKAELPGSICFIGWIGTSTTDIGTTAFSNAYYNVGLHATITNSILTGSFLDMLPWWIGGALALVFSLLVAFVIRNMQPGFAILTGAGFVIGIIAIGGVFFYATGVYPNLLTPTLSVFFSFIIQTFILFLRTAKEKSFIRNAFSRYLSNDVIAQLVNDPSRLELGGESKHMTAMFTDVKGFSTISEMLTPSELVQLLNRYLTEMSNIILGLRGTIDKYEGDAIIAFFGAPIYFDDHAHLACFSAIRMKRMEKILNDHLLAEKLSPSPLFTRIGINTGEMVVGNMGTFQKMDYTIMGSAVNLASRLEGVNKQYGTAIIASESTYEEAKAGIFVRKLDRVMVVGINKPVQLYEVIEEAGMVSEETKQAVEAYHEGRILFDKRDWDGAIKFFREAKRIVSDDGPSETFIKRCEEYKKGPPPDSWDGVYRLTMK